VADILLILAKTRSYYRRRLMFSDKSKINTTSRMPHQSSNGLVLLETMAQIALTYIFSNSDYIVSLQCMLVVAEMINFDHFPI